MAPAAAAAAGATVIGVGRRGSFELPGSVRFVAARVSGVAVEIDDPEISDELPEDSSGRFRLRLKPTLTFGDPGWSLFQRYYLAVEGEAWWHAYGEAPAPALAYEPVSNFRAEELRARLAQAYAEAAGRHLLVRFGLVRSSVGLGTVASDASDADPRQVRSSPYGFSHLGDRSMRLQVAAFPLAVDKLGPRLTVFAAADAVVEDDSADWLDGDRAYQGWAGVLGRVDAVRGGLGGLYRRQDHEQGGRTETGIVFATASLDLDAGPVALYADAEAAGYFGKTDFARSANRPGDYDILAAGGVLRAGTRWRRLEAALEGGYASGDDNPFDAELRSFSFDRERRVGLLMFGEALRLVSAAGAFNLADETYRAEPSRGFERGATEGAVRNAVYLNPRVGLRACEHISLTFGYLWAEAAVAYADPQRSGVAGGQPTSPRGAVEARALGHELNAGVVLDWQTDWALLRATAQGAWFDPGEVFDDPDGAAADDMLGLWLHGEATW